MADYDIKEVKPVSRASKTSEFKEHHTKEQKKKKKKKSSTSFWDVPTQYTTKDDSDLNYNYLDLEKKLEVASEEWGVNKISTQIIEIIQQYYQQFKDNNQNYNDSVLFSLFYPQAKESLKKAYQQAKEVLPPLPQDVKKLIVATYSQSIEKLNIWRENIPTADQEETEKTEIENFASEKLIKDIANLLIEQGIYLGEQKVHHPIINTKR
ncbi:MAG: hypothetical protein R6V17_03535 [Halanaerobacter sp.]